MTKAEQGSFEKWCAEKFGSDGVNKMAVNLGYVAFSNARDAFLAGYRAGFSAQHYDVDVRPVDVAELVEALELTARSLEVEFGVSRAEINFPQIYAALTRYRGTP